MNEDNEEDSLKEHQEEAVRLYIERYYDLYNKAEKCIKEDNLLLALKVLEDALNMANELYYKGKIEKIYKEIGDIKEVIRSLHLEIRRKDKDKISISNNNGGYFLANLQETLIEIEKHPTEEIDEGNFIQFENYRDEFIQFVRLTKDNWGIDIPINTEGEYFYSLQEENLSTLQVKIIVFNFLNGNFPIAEFKKIKDLDLQKTEFKNILNSIPTKLVCEYCGQKLKLSKKKCSFCGIEYSVKNILKNRTELQKEIDTLSNSPLD